MPTVLEDSMPTIHKSFEFLVSNTDINFNFPCSRYDYLEKYISKILLILTWVHAVKKMQDDLNLLQNYLEKKIKQKKLFSRIIFKN